MIKKHGHFKLFSIQETSPPWLRWITSCYFHSQDFSVDLLSTKEINSMRTHFSSWLCACESSNKLNVWSEKDHSRVCVFKTTRKWYLLFNRKIRLTFYVPPCQRLFHLVTVMYVTTAALASAFPWETLEALQCTVSIDLLISHVNLWGSALIHRSLFEWLKDRKTM